MDLLDQPCNARCHHEEILGFAGAGVPVSMSRAASSENGGAGVCFDFLVVEAEAKSP